MVTLSLLNRKGGVGKTTASVNLAAIFAKSNNKKVLLIDSDPQANSTTYLGKFLTKDDISIYDVLCGDTDIADAVIDTDIENLRLLPSNQNLSKADLEMASMPAARKFILQNKLNAMTEEYDYVIIDCPPDDNNLTINALTASDYAVIPCEATEYGVDSILAMSGFISEIQRCANQNLKVAGMLFTRKENTMVQNIYLDQFKQNLTAYHFFGTEIRKTTVVEKSLSNHTPLIVYAPNENVTKDYIAVAEELRGIIERGA
ncbi:AAA family ATPase [Ruminococcus sp.]|uniref:ParA family protein n=1 Tax=Ruminococcus sp. TaxID=41978 RepID=UPI001B5EBF00|nr:AAA family ATPase [Ruminococcus sp.]MBP5433583.1 ParA family protein [Ruminococcus sp.]